MLDRTFNCCRADSLDSFGEAYRGACISYAFAPHQTDGLCVIGRSFRRLAMEVFSRLKLTQEGQDDAAHKSKANSRLCFWFGRRPFSTSLCVKSWDVERIREHRFFTQAWGAALNLGEKKQKRNRRNI